MSTSVSATLDHLAEGRRPWFLLFLLCLALYVPGIVTLPVVDRDEARFVQASRQMLETGDFVRIRYQDEARNKKPVGIYWLQAASVAAFSDAAAPMVWPYRLVSLLGALASVLLLFHFGSQIFDRRTALLGAAIAASSLDAVFEAHLATTDATLCACAVAVQGSLGLVFLGRRHGDVVAWQNAAWFWAALAVGTLIKGPVVPLIAALTILALVAGERRVAWLLELRPLLGIPMLLVLVLPWFILIERATGGAFLREAIGHDLLGKVAGGQEAHGAPPGYYMALLSVTFWPGSLFLGLGFFWAWRHRRLPATRFLAAWIIPFWLVLELVPTKLPHYALPLYPALALICARALIAYDEEGFLPRSPLWLRVPALIWSLVAIGVGFALLGLAVKTDASFLAKTAAVVVASASAALVWHLWRPAPLRIDVAAPLVTVSAAHFIIVPGIALVLPGLSSLWLSAEASHVIRQYRQDNEAIAAIGYAEPSFVFLNGTKTALLVGAGVDRFLAAQSHALVLVDDPDVPGFVHAAAVHGRRQFALALVDGINYSNGHHMRMTLYRVEPS